MTEKKQPPGEESAAGAELKAALPSLGIDWDYYVAMLDEPDLSYEEKCEYVKAWWNIVLSFVHLGYRVDSVQTVLDELDIEETAKAIPASPPQLLSSDFRQSRTDRKDSAQSGEEVPQ
ncbi:hypothetical protein [Stappia sp. ES.058]|uniref:hypothetical protein n=1 Tax=Stappia sp. ES.058 TaxID=1881061 RepID=UPI00087C6F3A|nr:hypothetical protein [Stappia sp. ES.058]SDU42398.1 hypothetical protein SAMN05428979_3691 [Stappia sp. ES.058]